MNQQAQKKSDFLDAKAISKMTGLSVKGVYRISGSKKSGFPQTQNIGYSPTSLWERDLVEEWLKNNHELVVLATMATPRPIQNAKNDEKHTELYDIGTYRKYLNKHHDHRFISAEEALSNAISHKILTGVYFLFMERQLIYIGQSINISVRLNNHTIEFDSYHYVECSESELDDIESAYIHAYRPIMNMTATNGSKVAPISYKKFSKRLEKMNAQ